MTIGLFQKKRKNGEGNDSNIENNKYILILR